MLNVPTEMDFQINSFNESKTNKTMENKQETIVLTTRITLFTQKSNRKAMAEGKKAFNAYNNGKLQQFFTTELVKLFWKVQIV